MVVESSGPKGTGGGISSVRDRIAALEKTKNGRAAGAAAAAVSPPQQPETITETKIVTLEDDYGFEYEAPVTITTTTSSSTNTSKIGSTVNKEKKTLNNGSRQLNTSTNRNNKSLNYPRNVVNVKDEEEGTEESDDYGVAFDIPVYVDANITKPSSAKSTTIPKMYKYNDEEDGDYEEEDDDVVVLRPVPIDDDLYSQYTFDNLSGIVTQATAFDATNDNKSTATRGSTYVPRHDHHSFRNSHHSRRSVLNQYNQQQERQAGDNPTTIETTPAKNDFDDNKVDVECTVSGENPTASTTIRAVDLKKIISSKSSAVTTIEDTGNTSSFSSKIKIFERMNSSFSFGFNNNKDNDNDKDNNKDNKNKERSNETTATFPDENQDADIEKQQVGLCDNNSSSSGSNETEKEFSDIDLDNDVQIVTSGQKNGSTATVIVTASKKRREKKSTSSSSSLSPPSWFSRFSCSMDNRNFCALVTFFVLIIVIGTLVAVVTHYRDKESSISSSSGSAQSGTDPAASPSTGPAKGTFAPTYPGDTYAPTISASPTTFPTASPTTAMPTINYIDSMMEFFQDYQIMFDKGPNDPSYMALEWLNMEANLIDEGIELNGDLVQRFALLVLEYSLNRTQTVSDEDVDDGPETSEGIDRSVAQMNVHECEWPGIICGSKNVTSTTNPNSTETVDNIVKEIHFGSSGLVGTIPRQINLLSNLEYLDVSNNDLHGSLPETLYDLSSLRKIFAYKNQLTGTLSDRVGGKLNSLTHFHLSHNNLTGSIPDAWAPVGEITRPLQYFNVYSNALTGIIPSSLRFSNVWYFDVGRNNLEGPLPEDVGLQFVELRHLLLDHNSFNGTLPESYINVGNGRLESFHIDHNQLTGQVPGNHDQRDKLVEFTLHNNSFTKLGKDTCKLSVFNGGEMVEFKADEDICDCSPFCGQQ